MNEKKLKPFDLEAFKAGAKAVTRDGRPVRYLGEVKGSDYPLICAVPDPADPEAEEVFHYATNGQFRIECNRHWLDIFILPKTKVITRYLTVFIDEKGIFPGSLYETEEEALKYPGDNIKPIKIEIEYEE